MATPNQVPAAPVRAYVQGLLDDGMERVAICRAADVSHQYLSALLNSNQDFGRPAQLTIRADRAERLMAVRFEGPPPKVEPTICEWSETFQSVGYRVGRCQTCGQFAQIQTREGRAVLVTHPRPVAGALTGDVPPAFAEHPDCGTPRGHTRHMRAGVPACELCKAAKNGYDQGRNSALSAIHRATQGAVPWSLIGECETAMRAVIFRRPYPQLREVAVRFVRAVDAARESRADLDRLAA